MAPSTSSSPDAPVLHVGGCLCGAVRFQFEGAPIVISTCFCTMCRKQTGGALPAFATWPLAALTLLEGEPASYSASAQATRQFCARCGSPLFWRAADRDQIDVFLGSLDAPERMPAPSFSLWTRHRLPWVPKVPGKDFEQGLPTKG
jgi:hypothetical protein